MLILLAVSFGPIKSYHRRRRILKKRSDHAPQHTSQEIMGNLPYITKQLEASLYRNAPTFEAYMDVGTIEERLRQTCRLVMNNAVVDNRENEPFYSATR